MLRNWQFPDSITDCVRFHHLPQEANSARAAACVYLGNTIAHTLDDPFSAYSLPKSELEQVMQVLEITPKTMSAYSEKVLENMNFVNAML